MGNIKDILLFIFIVLVMIAALYIRVTLPVMKEKNPEISKPVSCDEKEWFVTCVNHTN